MEKAGLCIAGFEQRSGPIVQARCMSSCVSLPRMVVLVRIYIQTKKQSTFLFLFEALAVVGTGKRAGIPVGV